MEAPIVPFDGAPAAPPAKLTPPINVSKVRNENGVKDIIKKLLDHWGWFSFVPGGNAFGTQGLGDRLAIKNGVFLSVEAKFGYNKPKATQKAFALQVMANDGFAFCVNERNIDHLAWWLESFELSTQAASRGAEVSAEHGARMLNAISVLTDPFKGEDV